MKRISSARARIHPQLDADELICVLDSLTAHVAVLDSNGVILSVNQPWRRFAGRNELADDDAGVGLNYLKICDTAAEQHDADAAAVAAGIRDLINGECDEVYREYPCNSPIEERWFVARARAYQHGGRLRVVVSHDDITKRKLAEREVRILVETLEQRVAERTHVIEQQINQLRRLAADLTLVESRQRQALSEELHDYLAQLLVVVKMRLEALRKAPPTEDDTRARDALAPLNEAIEYTRSLVSRLHPQILFDEGLAPAIRDLARSLKQDDFLVTVNVTGAARRLPAEMLIFMYDATRELLFNAIKHSGARAATVGIDWGKKGLVVSVRDEGSGMAEAPQPVRHKFGLTHMRERLKAFEGELTINSAPDKGTTVSLALPLAKA